ncbi:dTDP-4-dehydrorhamnose reductase [Olleya sp. HaHaR_3_96]|uniref:dTDP-4-dehydrorhamnose reductase n=1 Tax=Olleya sp. HaHaR_3_96 TaxID=2745560 RepID=UPI001C4E765E|nr:dTDP-4-dehydrorhamnose reductase [Olleya sp. HaHaR_3_96]QXP60659.1 dTDP-4-dehydrorhamnose reductase [Olleya sp. HaHaR_3_96]
MIRVLVTGAGGQLGSCLKKQSKLQQTLDFVFFDSKDLDITNIDQIESFFLNSNSNSNSNFDYCINCAAYTAVDQAEDDYDRAYSINVIGVKYLATICEKYRTTLIHVSTDFVFSGSNNKPYREMDRTDPLGVYGITKLKGEDEIRFALDQHYIIRTSWLYSEFKSNFVKTMLKLSSEKEELSVVNDQKGTPTNANDLVSAILVIINSNNEAFGIYNFSNLGETTWYGFAKSIFDLTNADVKLDKVSSDAFVTKARRPKYSVLDKTKIITTFDLNIPEWKESLENHLKITYP